MNKKLKLYCTLFVVVLIFLLVTNVFHFNSNSWYQGDNDKLELLDEAPGFVIRDSINGGEVRRSVMTFSYEVNVAPKNASNQKVLVSKARKASPYGVEDQVFKINLEKIKVETPAKNSKAFNVPMVLGVLSAILGTIVLIWILCIVFKLIGRIRRGEIFVTGVSRSLETVGVLLSALYIYQWIVGFLFAQYCIRNIHLADYFVVYKNEADSMYILTGLALMIISQIILMGKDLKEEQELTI